MTIKNPFLQNAQTDKHSLLYFFLTSFLIIFLVFFTAIIVSGAAVIYTGSIDVTNYPPNILFLISMSIFPSALFGLWFGIRFFHKRNFKSVITPKQSINWKKMLVSGAIWITLNIIADFILGMFITPENYLWDFNINQYIPFFILAVTFIPVQSATEELVFRGYLMQTISKITKSAFLSLIISSVLFSAIHLSNPEVTAYGMELMSLYYLSMGLFLGYLTLKFQGLENAIGVHIANNLYGVLCVSIPNSALISPSLFKIVSYDALYGLVTFFIMAGLYVILLKIPSFANLFDNV